MNKSKIKIDQIELAFVDLINEHVAYELIEGIVDMTVLDNSYIGNPVLTAWKLTGTEAELRVHISKVRRTHVFMGGLKILGTSSAFKPMPKLQSFLVNTNKFYTVLAILNKDLDMTHFILSNYELGDEYHATYVATEAKVKAFLATALKEDSHLTNNTNILL